MMTEVRFFLNVTVGGATTSLEHTRLLPFAPRIGDRLVFCDVQCCEWGVQIPPDAHLVYLVRKQQWLVEMDDDESEWGEGWSFEDVVEHYFDCGFVEVEGCRDER